MLSDYVDVIIVTAGNPVSTKSEVFDFERAYSVCQSKNGVERWGAAGGIVENNILVCGGKSSAHGRHKDCTVIGKSK